MEFMDAMKTIQEALLKTGTNIDADAYDGLIVKKLAASNTLDENRNTNQTHIAITGEQMDIFPYLCADGYFYDGEKIANEDLKKYFIIKINLTIFESNCIYLGMKHDDIIFDGDRKITDSCVVRSKRAKQSDQLQLSLLNFDGEDFVKYRKILSEGTYMILLKCKGAMEYHVFGLKNNCLDFEKLDQMNNHFFRKSSITTVETSKFERFTGFDVEREPIPAYLSEKDLGERLAAMYNNPANEHKVTAIHMFGIKYGKIILEQGYSMRGLVTAAGINDSYNVEVNKGVNIYKSILEGAYGISFGIKNKKVSSKMHHNILYYGVPGSGKSYAIDKEVDGAPYERIVFHPDYTYSDFIGQVMPKLKKNEQGEEKLSYEFVSGPFIKAMKKAKSCENEMVYLIIEEINRGNAPAIFGDIFQLLDRDNDGSSKYCITNYDIAREVYGDENAEVRIPSNLTILATMNTSDQNVFTLDTAFQRRWQMKHIKNEMNEAEHKYDRIMGSDITWGSFATEVNEVIRNKNVDLAGSEDKQLGIYFVKPEELTKDRFSEKALKYLWDDAFKFDHEEIFDVNIRSLEELLEAYENCTGDPLEQVIKPEIYGKMKASEYQKLMDMTADTPEEAYDESETFEAEVSDNAGGEQWQMEF